MGKENQISVSFDLDSAKKYREAAKFMVGVADRNFGIKVPQTISDSWESTLELMYYFDHVLDNIQSASDRERIGHYAIECMFADPIDWDYLNFGEPNVDKALNKFRRSFLDLTRVGDNSAELALSLLHKTEELKDTIGIENVASTRMDEGQKCADMLMCTAASLTKSGKNNKYDNWFIQFWRFGNLADLLIDFGDDVSDCIIQLDNNMSNRMVLGVISIKEFLKLIKISNPKLIVSYARAGIYLVKDRQKSKSPRTINYSLSLDTLPTS